RVTKLRIITAVVAALALAGLGVGWLAYTMPVDPPAPQKAPEPARVARDPVVADKSEPGARHLVLQAPPTVSVNAVAVSPDGSIIASSADGVRLYDARTGALLRAIGDAGGRVVAFAPDGRSVAAAGFHLEKPFGHPSKLLPIYDVQTGKRVQTL